MCRTGGRRCPGEHDPAKIAARNARRRAKYAADKAAGPKKLSRKKDSTDSKTTITPLPAQNPLTTGVSSVPAGKDVDPTRFQTHTLVGTIDYTTLGPRSYKKFGFTKTPTKEMWTEQPDHYSYINFPNTIGDETALLTKTERQAVEMFTGNGFRWINEACYSGDNLALVSPIDPVDCSFAVKEKWPSKKVFQTGLIEINSSQHLETLEAVTTALDSALAKGPKHQRIVYRIVNSSETHGDADKWAKQERELGTEVVFDGYTSTTTSHEVVWNMMEENPKHEAVYEILTPEGMDVDLISAEHGEAEVLLPRNQRYMVVGKHKDVNGLNVIQLVAVNSKGEILDGTNADPIKPLVSKETEKLAARSTPLAAWYELTNESITHSLDARNHPSIASAVKNKELRQKHAAKTLDKVDKVLRMHRYTKAAKEFKQFMSDHNPATPEDALDILRSQL